MLGKNMVEAASHQSVNRAVSFRGQHFNSRHTLSGKYTVTTFFPVREGCGFPRAVADCGAGSSPAAGAVGWRSRALRLGRLLIA